MAAIHLFAWTLSHLTESQKAAFSFLYPFGPNLSHRANVGKKSWLR